MIDRPSPRRFIAMMTVCALTLTGVVITGIGGFPLLVARQHRRARRRRRLLPQLRQPPPGGHDRRRAVPGAVLDLDVG